MRSRPASKSAVYHERQQLLRCGLHATNALLRGPIYTASTMDEIADQMAVERSWFRWSHPHRAIFGLGNYDVNVIMCALERRGLCARWMGNGVSVRGVVEGSGGLVGFLVNVGVKGKWLGWASDWLMGERRHWLAVVKYGNAFYEVDSLGGGGVMVTDVVPYLEGRRRAGGIILSVLKTDENDSREKG
eukprot:GFKZ01009459.1.p1 GENE.GFKZ01009459.1~~GFKZ01009459.1.p1  ORF type:complete len:200 (-),score=19.68 GFKZ01009459.1:106-669(-)